MYIMWEHEPDIIKAAHGVDTDEEVRVVVPKLTYHTRMLLLVPPSPPRSTPHLFAIFGLFVILCTSGAPFKVFAWV